MGHFWIFHEILKVFIGFLKRLLVHSWSYILVLTNYGLTHKKLKIKMSYFLNLMMRAVFRANGSSSEICRSLLSFSKKTSAAVEAKPSRKRKKAGNWYLVSTKIRLNCSFWWFSLQSAWLHTFYKMFGISIPELQTRLWPKIWLCANFWVHR